MILETERLILREVTQDDYAGVAAMLRAPGVAEYDTPAVRAPMAPQFWIDRCRDRYRRHGFALWAVDRKASPGFIGLIGILNHEIPEVSDFEVGWHLQKPHWGQGFAREAARACLAYGFTALDRPRMISLISPDNERSIKVALGLGMTLRQTLYIEKFDRETAVYGIERPAAR